MSLLHSLGDDLKSIKLKTTNMENKLNSLTLEQNLNLEIMQIKMENMSQFQEKKLNSLELQIMGLENTLFSSQKISETFGNYTEIQSENLNSKLDQINKSQKEIDAKFEVRINQLNSNIEGYMEVKNCSELEKNKSKQFKFGLSTLLTPPVRYMTIFKLTNIIL
jgi:TATA-box binding protein (TBP) (component of TFIID and TFIIIB)